MRSLTLFCARGRLALLFLCPAVVLLLLLSSCGTPPAERVYALQGQVLAVAPNRVEATIKHEDIKGFMPAMTMPYKVKEAKLLDSIAPGDLINATLVVVSNDAYLTEVKKVGSAPLEQAPVAAPAASSGFELLKAGEAVPDAPFINQDGKTLGFSAFKGSTVVVTFIYTTCPLPTFCPLMDRHFATIQTSLKNDPSLTNVHLVSISFDPITDTPPVLKKHARTLNADPLRWTFLTGRRDDIDRFAARFGVSVARASANPLDITHTLRTAIVDADGKLVKVYTGNEWTPAQVLEDLKPVVRSS
jgi:protein SCO1